MRSTEFAGDHFPKHHPNANATNTTLELMDSSPRTDREILCAPAGRTAHAATAVPRVGAGVYLVWHTNVQNASPKNTERMLVRLREALGPGPVTIGRREKAKVAARVAANLDDLHWRLARFPASSASTTPMSCVRPTLLWRRLREVIAVVARVCLKSLACFCLLDLWNHGASWITRCAWQNKYVV